VLQENLLRSAIIRDPSTRCHLQRRFPSAGSAYNAALATCLNDFVVLVHQDVYIPEIWAHDVVRQINLLDRVDPTWAVLGIYGATSLGTNVGYVWSSGINKLLGEPFDTPIPVESIDELLIVLRRSTGLQFDEDLPGFHLHGTDIVQTARAQGRGAYAVCAPVVHNSRPILYLDDSYFKAHRYLARKWKTKLPIHNCILPISGCWFTYQKMRGRQVLNRIRYGNVDREKLDRNYDSAEIARRLNFEPAPSTCRIWSVPSCTAMSECGTS